MTYDVWKTTEPDNDVCLASPRCPCLEYDDHEEDALCESALNEMCHPPRRREARARCAEILNARNEVCHTCGLDSTGHHATRCTAIWMRNEVKP